MEPLHISDPGERLSEADLSVVEGALGIQFPEQIRRFYLTNNGGVPERALFRNDNADFLVNEFLPIKYGQPGLRLEDIYRLLKRRVENPFPSYLVPFGSDPGGDLLCFSLRPTELGAIYGYRSEYYDKEEEAVVLLAPTLAEFLEGLVSD